MATIFGTVGKENLGGTPDDDILYGGPTDSPIGTGNDYINGGQGNDLIFGGDGDDFLVGGLGEDELNGGVGNDRLSANDRRLAGDNDTDRLIGGLGNDLYEIDDTDIVEETSLGATGGIDTIHFYGGFAPFGFTYDMSIRATEVEKLRLEDNPDGTRIFRNINVIGNNLDNNIIGNKDSNTLRGGDGDDTLFGGGGTDFLLGDEGNDILLGHELLQFGQSPAVDFLNGGVGNDTLYSGFDYQGAGGLGFVSGGGDRLIGGDGNDTFILYEAASGIGEGAGQGTDTVISYIDLSLSDSRYISAELENLELRGNASNGTGNNLANTITGTVATVSYTFNGGGGKDMLIGNDADDILNGGGGDDTLMGGGGNDILDGGANIDSFDGGAGDDIYIINAPGETITDSSGVDEVRTSSDYVLATGNGVENLILVQGSAARRGTGNELDNEITGNSASNFILGGDGEDILLGTAQANTGDTETDYMRGGTGADIFDLRSSVNPGTTLYQTGGANSFVLIFDYSPTEGDQIRIGIGATVNTTIINGNTFLDIGGDRIAAIVGTPTLDIINT